MFGLVDLNLLSRLLSRISILNWFSEVLAFALVFLPLEFHPFV